MSIYASQLAAIIPTKPQPTVWAFDWPENQESNEGDFVTYRVQAANVVPGVSRIYFWGTDPGYAPARWLEDWITLIGRRLMEHGLQVDKLSATTTPPAKGTAAVLITVPIGCKWQGEPILCRNRSRLNRRDDKQQRAQGQLLPALAYPEDAATNVLTGRVFFYLNDTSKTPTGISSISMQRFDVDGGPAKGVLEPLEGGMIRVFVTNAIPGTQVRMYGSGTADDARALESRLGVYINAAGAKLDPEKATWVNGTVYPPPPGSAWYNGGTMTIREGWTNDDYFEYKFKVGAANVPTDGSSLALDIISNISFEGTAADFDRYQYKGDWAANLAYARGDVLVYVPNGLRYIALQDIPRGLDPETDADGQGLNWREFALSVPNASSYSYTIRGSTARFWEVRAVAAASMINYEIVASAFQGVTAMMSVQNAPPGFLDALQQAAAGSPITVQILSQDLVSLTANERIAKQNQSLVFSVGRSGSGVHRLSLSNDGSSVIGIKETAVYYTDPVLPADPVYAVGVNNSSGEFGTGLEYGGDYLYPSRPERTDGTAHESMDYLLALGVRMMRLPFKWKRIQRNGPYTPLSGERPPGPSWSGPLDIARIDEIVDYWTSAGGILLLDMHDYMGNNTGGRVKYDMPMVEGDLPIEALCDVWVRLANRYHANPRVWFGLMNEPNGEVGSPRRCRAVFQTVVNAIRGRTPALNKILVPGAQFSSTANWVANEQAAIYEDFYDPADNMAFEPHLYQDADAAGFTGQCIVNAQDRLLAITAWARQKGRKLFMGEVSGGDPNVTGQQMCATTTPACYSYMRNNKDVWIGFTVWGYGPWWPGSYVFNLNPSSYQLPYPPPNPKMQMLVPYIALEY